MNSFLSTDQSRVAQAEASTRIALRALNAHTEFVSVVSHELRTPLTSLTLLLQMAQRFKRVNTTEAFQTVSELLDQAEQQCLHLTRLTSDLLDFSKIESGQFELKRTPVDLSLLARNLVDRYRAAMAEAGCAFSFRAPETVIGEWDSSRVEQVLVNLLSNAMKYGRGRPVELFVEKLEGSARITVRDEGVGISLEDQSRIFERFERADTLGSFSGLGLGLFLTRQIVEAHHGRIQVVSAPGKGATFSVELPSRQALDLSFSA